MVLAVSGTVGSVHGAAPRAVSQRIGFQPFRNVIGPGWTQWIICEGLQAAGIDPLVSL